MILKRFIPFISAISIYALASTLIMAALVWRIMCAVTTQVSVREGSKTANNLAPKPICLSMIARLGKMPS